MRLAVLAFLATVALADQSPRVVVPDSPDLTIRTRTVRSGPGHFTSSMTLRMKGPRQLMETAFGNEARPHVMFSTISQCDVRQTLVLNHNTRMYAYQPLVDVSRYQRAALASRESREDAAQQVREDPLRTMTIDAVDTGERQQFGPLTARHVITTTTTDDRRQQPARSITEIQDGWYVDLPPVGCVDWGSSTVELTAIAMKASSAPPSVPSVKLLGRAKRGFPLIETTRFVGAEQAQTTRVELVDVSSDPIDPSVFDVPAGYQPALVRWDGTHDMNRPDTLFNRAALVWQSVRNLAGSYWR